MVNRFTLSLLPHPPPGVIVYSGKGYYRDQLSPMSNACLTVWNSTLSESSLALPSQRVRKYLSASTWNRDANLEKSEKRSLSFSHLTRESLFRRYNQPVPSNEKAESFPGYLSRGQQSFPRCNKCSNGRHGSVYSFPKQPVSWQLHVAVKIRRPASGMFLLKRHFLAPTTFKWGHLDYYYNSISIKNRNIWLGRLGTPLGYEHYICYIRYTRYQRGVATGVRRNVSSLLASLRVH